LEILTSKNVSTYAGWGKLFKILFDLWLVESADAEGQVYIKPKRGESISNKSNYVAIILGICIPVVLENH
jgi:hypothetical protein